MTDLRKIPWRLPAGYEDLKPFWDDFIKKLGLSISEVDVVATPLTDVDGGWIFDGNCGLITEAATAAFDCLLITGAAVYEFDCGAIA